MDPKKQYSMDRVSRVRRLIEERMFEKVEKGSKTDLFSPNFVAHTPWHTAVKHGAVNAKEKGPFVQRLFSDASISVLEAVEDGDKVVVHWRLRGKWTKPFAGIKPTGQPIDITGMNIYRFVGDKIVEEHGEVDLASFATQAIGGGVNPAACAQALKALARINPEF
jgi:predicted ester cyclase